MESTRVGSVFLGDIQRHRHLSTSTRASTPPSSPPPTTTTSIFSSLHPHHTIASPASSSFTDIDIDMDPSESPGKTGEAVQKKQPLAGIQEGGGGLETRHGPGKVDPMLALELRLRWLEALILGVKQDLGKDRKGKGKEEYAVGGSTSATGAAATHLKPGETLVRLAETVQQKLDKFVEGNEGLKRFMNTYDQHAHLLTPSFALSGILQEPPTYDKMSPEEINAFLAEMEPDIRAADRDMLEIEALEKKGILGAGKLAEYEKLKPRLEQLLKAQQEDAELATSLEGRIASLMERHATYADTLSELFVAWDDAVTEAEDKLSRMERERTERKRLGLA